MNPTQPQRPDTAQHTPTPWRIDKNDGSIVSDHAPQSLIVYGDKQFIVRAVNNHENLIGHLHECVELLEQAKRYADKSGDTGMAAFYASGADQARAALAAAKDNS